MEQSTFEHAKERLLAIKKMLDLKGEEIDFLSVPKKINKTTLEVEGEKIQAWRILYNDVLGPGKGGIRFHQNVDEDEVKSLSFWMTLKNSLVGLPYGGAKGGVRFNPKEKSKEYLEKVSRAYIDAFWKELGSAKDVPAPDVYTNDEIMAWMLDQFEKNSRRHEPGMITGKPLALGGCALRGTATAKGGFIIIKELLHHVPNLGKKPTIAIQGFGNAGMNIAKMLSADGFKVVAVSDSRGGIKDLNGLDINKVIEIKNHKKSVMDTDYEKVSNEDLLELPVDILVLAALENQITKKNAQNIKAKYIVELANGPVDFEADSILVKNGIVVVPDILANAGGVIVSYFEWAQNLSGGLFEEQYLEKKLFEKMESAWHSVYEFYKDNEGIDLRTAAYALSVKRILLAAKYRGVIK